MDTEDGGPPFAAHTARERRRARLLARIAAGGIAVSVLAVVLVHLTAGPGYSILDNVMSEFVYSPNGTLIALAMFTMGLGSLALLLGLHLLRLIHRPLVTVLLAVWGGGLVIASVIPADPPGSVQTGLTLTAEIHRWASTGGFICLPLAALMMTGQLRASPDWRLTAGRMRGLALCAAAILLLMALVNWPGGRVMIGLVQRVLLAIEAGLVTVLVIGVLRATRPGRRDRVATPPAAGRLDPPRDAAPAAGSEECGAGSAGSSGPAGPAPR
ncbi:DUF998 domain-containing protein [Allonocardiopsis opalescens]|nr:DUF998 domain-containing protein [Allonocardiopsis opalescens]